MTTLDELKKRLDSDPAAQLRFLSDCLTVLENQGVDVHDPLVQKALGIETGVTLKDILEHCPVSPAVLLLPGKPKLR